MSVLRRALPLCCCLLGAVAPLFSQTLTRTSPELAPLDALPGDQSWPHLALETAGGYLVWQDNTIDGQRSGIAAQRFDHRFQALGQHFRVNHTAAGAQERPAVALLPNGGAIFVWQGGEPGFQDICARILNPDGTFLTRDLILSERSTSTKKTWTAHRWVWVQNKLRRQRLNLQRTVRHLCDANQTPRVVALPDGSAAVVYAGARKTVTNATEWLPKFTLRNRRFLTNSVRQNVTTRTDHLHDILLQRLSATGAKLGPEITVNQFTDHNQRAPALALLADGNLLIIWASEQESAQPVSAGLEARYPNLNLNPELFSRILGENRLVISGRILAPDGTPITDEFRLDGDGPRLCANPEVVALPDGGFLAAWSQRDFQRTNGWDVYARAFGPDRAPRGEAQRLNTRQLGDQAGPKISPLQSFGGAPAAHHLVIWTSMGQDGSREGIFGRLLTDGAPVGDETLINTTTRFAQRQPAIASHNAQIITLWSSFNGVAPGMELMAQKWSIAGGPSPIVRGQSSTDPLDPTNHSGATPPTTPTETTTNTAPPATNPASVAVAIQSTATKLSLTWNTLADAVYQVQSSTNLATWTDVGSEHLGAGGPQTLRLEKTPGATFFRIKRIR